MAAVRYNCLLLYILAIAVVSPASAQDICTPRATHRGRDFIITYPRLHSTDTLNIYLTSVEDGNATLTSDVVANATYNLAAQDVTRIVLDEASVRNLTQSSTSRIQRKFIEIQSNVDISVYMASDSAVAALVLPSNRLGPEYIATSYRPAPRASNTLIVTAVVDDTEVQVIDLEGKYISFLLNAKESYTYSQMSTNDLSGVRIASARSRPVSVVVGNTEARAPSPGKFYGCSLLTIPLPATMMGRQYIVPSIWPKTAYLIRIYTADIPARSVSYANYSQNGYVQIAAHKYFDIMMGTSPTLIQTDTPVSVVVYGVGQHYDLENGGEFMMAVPPVTLYDADYLFPLPLTDAGYTNTLAVMVHAGVEDGLRLDGKPVQWQQEWYLPGSSGYKVLSLNVNGTVHSLTHTWSSVTFGAVLYGLQISKGFGFPLGFRIAESSTSCLNGGHRNMYGNCRCLQYYAGRCCEHDVHPTNAPTVAVHPTNAPTVAVHPTNAPMVG